MRHLVLLLLIPLLVLPSSVTAQQGQRRGVATLVRPVPEGDTVRVWAGNFGLKKTKLTVLGWADTTALFTRLAGADSLTVPFAGVTRMEVLRGRSTALGVLRGSMLGMSLGMVIGMVVGQAAVSGCTEFLCGLNAMSYLFGGMLIGTGLGAGVGAAYPMDRWERVDLPVEGGFPEYHKPFNQTVAFRLLLLGVLAGSVAIINF